LDKYFPDVPVVLNRVDGHAIIVNSKVLAMANITRTLKCPGGQIEIKKRAWDGQIINETCLSIIRSQIENTNCRYWAEKSMAIMGFNLR
jgi:predicted amidohydrolase YtcJ